MFESDNTFAYVVAFINTQIFLQYFSNCFYKIINNLDAQVGLK